MVKDTAQTTYFLPHRQTITRLDFRVIRDSTSHNGINAIIYYDSPKDQVSTIAEYDVREPLPQGFDITKNHLVTIPTGYQFIAHHSHGCEDEHTPEELRNTLLYAVNHAFINSNVLQNVPTPELAVRFGHSNHFEHNLINRFGVPCYDRAAILASLARTASLEARLVGFTTLEQHEWEQVVTQVGEVPPMDTIGDLNLPSEALLLHLRHAYPEIASTQTGLARLIESYSGMVSLTPDNELARIAHSLHVWVEFPGLEGKNTILSLVPSPYMSAVFKLKSPQRFVYPELVLEENISESYWKKP